MGLFFKLACADNKKSSKLSLLSDLHGHSNVVFEFKRLTGKHHEAHVGTSCRLDVKILCL